MPIYALIFLLILLPSMTFADVRNILGPLPEEEISQQALAEDWGLSFTISGGLGAASYSLDSVGYNVFLPLKLSPLWFAGLNYKVPHSRFSLTANVFGQNVSFDKLEAVSPTFLTVNTQFYDALVEYEISSYWSIAFGYRMKFRWASRTTPLDVVSSVNSAGPIALAKYIILPSAQESYQFDLTAFFPNYYDETSTSSGYSNSSVNLRLRGKYLKKLNPTVSVGIGLWIEYDFSAFSGTGTRLTTNARETFFKTYIPFLMELKF